MDLKISRGVTLLEACDMSGNRKSDALASNMARDRLRGALSLVRRHRSSTIEAAHHRRAA